MSGAGSVGVVIAAAGSSQRMGGMDKVFAWLGDKPLLAWSVEVCERCQIISRIAVALNDSNMEWGRTLVEERGWAKTQMCRGGARRQDSVQSGLRLVGDVEWVVIHDAARPFLTEGLIRQGLEAAKSTGAAVAGMPAKDTVKMVDERGVVEATPDRSRLWLIQTPQVFRRQILEEAYKVGQESATDDASLVERAGYRVQVYEGNYQNVKVTMAGDLKFAEVLLGSGR